MPHPRFPHRLLIQTPSPATLDPVSRNQIPGAAVAVAARGYLAQRPTTQLASSVDLSAEQDTSIALFDLLVPTGTVLTDASTVTDLDGAVAAPGAVFRVEGTPADRYSLVRRRSVYRAATVRLVSDMQE